MITLEIQRAMHSAVNALVKIANELERLNDNLEKHEEDRTDKPVSE